MISYIRHNSVFDLGSRTGVSTCKGLYAELDDIYSKYINPQVRVWYVTDGSTMDCLCNMAGKQVLANGTHAFIFQNGSISVTVDEQDNVTIADSGSGGGGGGVNTVNLDEIPVYTVQEGVTNRNTSIWLDDGGWYDSYELWFVSDLEVPAILLYNTGTREVQLSSFRVKTINNYVAENPIGSAEGCYLMSADTVYIVSPYAQDEPSVLFVVNPTAQYKGLS